MTQSDEDKILSLEGISEIDQRAIKSNLLEGIIPDAALLEALRCVNRGEMTREDFKKRGVVRILKKNHADNNHEK